VIDTRVSNKAKGRRGKPGSKVSEVSLAKKLQDIKSQVAKLKRTLASLKSSKIVGGGTDNSTDNDSTSDNAGDSFGGRQQKRARFKN
jgi:hypothetical protein